MKRAAILIRVGQADREIFERVARARTPWLNRALGSLSMAAEHSKLWLAIAAALTLFGGRRGKRAALRGTGSVAVTSLLVNQAIKRLVRRPRPSLRNVPAARRLRTVPTTTSFPSGHAASAAAFAVGAASELPAAALPLAPLAAAVAYSRVHVGVHYPLDVAVGAGVGAAVAGVSRLQWPVLPARAQHEPPSSRSLTVESRQGGRGVSVVVNSASGSKLPPDPANALRRHLPAAEIVELDGGADVGGALRSVGARCEVLGVCGGDGTAVTAAEVALETGRPLLVVPAGTLNHLARDLRIDSVGEAVEALEAGAAAAVDVAEIDGRPFLNTASMGGYTKMLAVRERLEKRIGRWPAHLLAAAQAVLASRPTEIVINGRRRTLWMVFVGNCRHEPAGFAPSWRPRLDDGVLDVRLLSGERPLARVRLLLSILGGRLTRSAAYEQFEVRELSVEFPGETTVPLARDGESFRGNGSFTISKRPRALCAYTGVANADAAS